MTFFVTFHGISDSWHVFLLFRVILSAK